MKKVAAILAVLAMAGVGEAVNLLANGSFESPVSAEDWGTHWGTFITEGWNLPPQGSTAAFIRGRWGSEETSGGFLQTVAVKEGREYVLGVSLYFDNGWAADAKVLKLEFFDGDDNLLRTYTNELLGLKDGRWVRKDIRGLAPAGAVRAQVVLEATGVGEEGILGADDFVLEESEARTARK